MRHLNYILFLLFILLAPTLNAETPYKDLVKRIVTKLDNQIARNNWNDANGRSEENNYIIDIREIFEDANTEFVITSDPNYSFVSQNVRDQVNNDLIQLSRPAPEGDKIHLYYLLNSNLLAIEDKEQDETAVTAYRFNNEWILDVPRAKSEIRSLMNSVYSNSTLINKNEGRSALVAITPVSVVQLGDNNNGSSDELKYLYLRSNFFGEEFSGLRDQNLPRLSEPKFSSDPDQAFVAHNNIYKEALINYEESERQTSNEVAIDESQYFYLVDNYVQRTEQLKNSNMPTDIQSMATALDNLSGKYIALADGTSVDSEGQKKIDRLEEKLNLLAQKTDHRIYVVIKKVDYVIPINELNSVAQQVRQTSAISGSQNIIITIPVYNGEAVNRENGQLENFSLPMQGVYSDNTPIDNVFSPTKIYFDNVIDIYQSLDKPFVLYSYYVSFNGDIVANTSSSDNISGHDIYEYNIWVDRRIESYKQLVSTHKSLVDGYNIAQSRTGGREFATLLEQINNLDIKLWNFSTYYPEESYSKVDHGIKEIFLEQKDPTTQIGIDADKFAKWYVWNELKGLGLDIERQPSPSDDHFIIGRNLVVYNQTLDAIDKVSLALMPTQLDVLADLAGAIYTGYHEDWVNSSLYAAGVVGVAVPFLSGGGLRATLKALAKGSKRLKRIGNNVQLITKVDALYTGFPFRLRKKLPWSLLEKIADANGDDLIRKMLNADLLDDDLIKLGNDLADPDFFKAFVGNPELVDAWALASKHSSISGDIAWVTKIDGWTKAGASGTDVTKLVDEVAGNSSLKAAFEADEVVYNAWKRVDNGGIPNYTKHPDYLNSLKKVTKYEKEAEQGVGGVVKYYRVQTEHPLSKLLTVNNGDLIFNKPNKALNISTTSRAHADYYAAKKIAKGNNVEIIEFEVPKSIDIQMKQAAIPQEKAPSNLLNTSGNAPKIVDPSTPGDPFELTQYWNQIIEQNYIQGSAKIVN